MGKKNNPQRLKGRATSLSVTQHKKHRLKNTLAHPKPGNGPRVPQKKKQSQPQPPKPIIPFKPTDQILLFGEGDFSFSRSLLTHYSTTNLTATSHDSEAQLATKYPQASENISFLRDNGGATVLYDVDATKVKCKALNSKKKKGAGFDLVVFMFPHVGGLSTHLDRQVRANQELLLGFFCTSKELLRDGGKVLVTLFEGAPYDQWDVRDLAKRAGFRTQVSFRFQSDVYPGYKHARTLGNIQDGGGWKGEERDARSFVFEIDDGSPPGISTKQKKRKHEEEGSSDDEDQDNNK